MKQIAHGPSPIAVGRAPGGAACARPSRGFTLLELMVTVAVVAILVSIGVPGFFSFIQNNRAATHTNELVTAINLARSEATRRGAPVLVCSSTNGTTCNGGTDWSGGWVVTADNGDLIRSWPPRTGGANVITGPAAQLRFRARGTVDTGGVFQVRLPRCTGNQGRNVAVNAAGRVNVTRVNC